MKYLEHKLRMACQENDYKEAENLLKSRGVDANSKNKKGMTPLMVAFYFGNYEIAKLVLEYGAEVNAKDKNGNNAMDYAKGTYDKFVKLLEEHTKEHTND